ncbi:hypothetical protein EGH22_20505 [Halomicroarcula sp. F28]|uniref:hypothetical protein n=1 Tax=Haloarcula salinisoli TaxID=2487746 RepID=UPI001C731143|nr:hypothetical protein [Halomicroarcula salinisoli]MBX0288716.1 hypothetical protein [Halomicroarcula salinisoli]
MCHYAAHTCDDGGDGGGDDGGDSGGDGGGDSGGDGGGDGGGIDIDIEFPVDSWVDKIDKQIVESFDETIDGGIELFFDPIKTGLADKFEGLFEYLLTPLIATPAPKGPSSQSGAIDLAFSSASNAPWNTLVPNFYFKGVVGLALGIQFLALAAVGLRYKAMNPAVRKQVGRRLLFAFFAVFFWLPAASMAGQLFNAIGRQLVFTVYSESHVKDTLFALELFSNTGSIGLGVFFVFFAVFVYVYLKVLFITVGRWIILIVLTLCMPLVASFWALEVWPFNRFSGLAAQIAGAYPGLLAGGIPPAVLIRLSLSTTNWGLGGDFAIFIALITLFVAGKSQKIMIRRSANMAMTVSQQALGGAKKSVGKPVKIGAAATAAGATLGAAAASGGTAGAATGAASTTAKGAQTTARGASKARAVSGGIGVATNVAKGNVSRSSYQAHRLGLGREQAKRSGEAKQSSDAGENSNETATTNGVLDPHSTGPFPEDGDDDSVATPVSVGGRESPDAAAGTAENRGKSVPYWEWIANGAPAEDKPPVNERASPDRGSDAGSTADTAGTASEQSTGTSLEDLFSGGNGPLGPDAYRDPDARIDYQDNGSSER